MPIVLVGNLELSIDRVLQRTLILSNVRIHKDTLTRGVEMTVAIQKMTLEEFLAYDDGTDKLYEEQVFVGNTKIESSVLESLDLRVDRVLQGR